ncbi:NAD-dependent epimerase/dehydratase [Candidatus Magnetomoraceae bacterium gMMP-1]
MTNKNKSIRNILVTGNLGYIGSVIVPMLKRMDYTVIGLDTGYYNKECLLYEEVKPSKQISKDIRNISTDDLKNIDGVIHLAALSNDPLGELEPTVTEEINLRATLKLARLAKDAGVKRFIYASSQSMYGIADNSAELDEDHSEKNPLTSYAATKWMAECELKKMSSDSFTVVCFRPSTVFGASPKLRCDIVYNNLVACAYTTGKIEIKSDGTPWRPVIHVNDVSNAFIAGLTAPKELVENESFNIGIKDGNYTVRQLAEAAQKVVPGSSLTFTGEHGSDSRTYRVSFKKILSKLDGYFRPEWDLIRGGRQLVDLFDKTGFTEQDFRNDKCNRLARLRKLIESKRLSKELKWVG